MLHCSMFRGYSSPSKVSTNRTENTSRPFWLLKSTIKRSCFQLSILHHPECTIHNPPALSVEKSDKTNNSTETLVNRNQSSGCILKSRILSPNWWSKTRWSRLNKTSIRFCLSILMGLWARMYIEQLLGSANFSQHALIWRPLMSHSPNMHEAWATIGSL